MRPGTMMTSHRSQRRKDERYCHIFIKDCSGEDYTGFFRTAGYIENNSSSVCDSEQCCIVDGTPMYCVFHCVDHDQWQLISVRDEDNEYYR